MQLPVNTLLQGGKYKIIRFINSGGFGCTYEAEHTLFNTHVAIKEFFKEDLCNRDERTNRVSVGVQSKAETVARLKKKFMEEAAAIFKMSHPGIVRVIDIFEENGTAYYVMDFIDGCSLSDMVRRRGKLSEKEALHYILQVVDALQYVHSRNRLHLDIKPGNIMVDKQDRAILIDFGASKHYNEDSGKQDSTLLGVNTPGYTPVEQVAKKFSKFNPATDIYALGATLYKLLTGIAPMESILRADEDDENEIFDDLPPTLSASTREAIMAAMQIKSINRPQSLEEFKKMLCGDVDNQKKKGISNDDTENTYDSEENAENEATVYEEKTYGYYPKKKGEAEYGTLEVCKIPVKDPLPMPDSIYIKLMPNNYRGLGYEIDDTKILIFQDGEKIVNYKPNTKLLQSDVKDYLIENGFLSKEHWEMEETTALMDNSINVTVLFKYNSGRYKKDTFIRNVTHAQHNWHDLLLNATENLLLVPTLHEILDRAQKSERNMIKGHEFVDLGLSVKWATCNVGAERPSDYGDYFAWGETAPKAEYTEENSVTYNKFIIGDIPANASVVRKKWWQSILGESKRDTNAIVRDMITISKIKQGISGDFRYDAACAICGGTWRLPTAAEIDELVNKCKHKWTTQDGHNGYLVTGPNGKSIFLPAAGWSYGSSLNGEGEYGSYWSSTPFESGAQRAYCLGFGSGYFYGGCGLRVGGFTVRAVSE